MTSTVSVDATNTFVLTAAKDANTLAVFRLDASASKPVAEVASKGARHGAFHPNGHFLYVISETANTVTGFELNATNGQLTQVQPPVSTLPVGFSGSSYGAEVQVSRSGDILYASNRGADTIASFRIETDGRLALLHQTKTGGKTPRHFQIDPSGRFLLAANQDSGSVVVLKIGEEGALTPFASTDVPCPAYVGAIDLGAR